MRLLPLLFPTNRWALLGIVAALANAALRVAIIPLFVTPVFDRVINGRDLSALPNVLVVAGGVVVAGAVALFSQDALLGRAAAELAARWRERLYGVLLGRTPGKLPGTSGGLSSRILTDLKEVEAYYQYGLGSLVAETVTLLGIFAVLFYYNAVATFVLLLLAVPLVLLLYILGRRLERTATASQAALEKVGAHLQEGLRHHALVRAFAAGRFMLSRFAHANNATRRSTVRRSLLAALQTPSAQLLIFGAVAVLVALLARSAAQGNLTAGEMVAYLVLTLLLATPAQLLPKAYASLQQARAARTRLLALNIVEPTNEVPAYGEASPSPASANRKGVALEDVSFAYGDAAPVLEKVSIELPERGLVALVGESGSGKTTLLQLLLRFLAPSDGHVRLNGHSLDTLSEDDLRGRVGYVPQTPDLLRGSLRDNVSMGRAYSDVQLWRALNAVGLEATVRALPAGLEHTLLEDGGGFSGGQRGRLAVARALVGEPEVLLLDEPSANLDAESERQLVEALREQAAQRLVLVVAHRPALVEAADIVLDLERLNAKT